MAVLLAAVLVLPPATPGVPAPPAATVDDATRDRVAAAYGSLPLSFEPNQGQADGPAQFLARGPGYALALTPAEAVLSLRTGADARADAASVAPDGATTEAGAADRAAAVGQGTALRLRLVGGDAAAAPVAEEALAGAAAAQAGRLPGG